MPSTSPGDHTPSAWAQVLPGAPTESLQSLTTYVFRFKRYVTYISGRQLNILSAPNTLVQALTFRHPLVTIAAETDTGKIVVASKSDVFVLLPVTEGWTKIWWEKSLALKREDAGDEASRLSWGDEGEILIGGDKLLSLFSTLPSSRTPSPKVASASEEPLEERRALWSKPVSSPVLFAEFSPTGSIIATCARYDRLVKIWRRLSFEEGLFDYTYLPHQGIVTHVQWRPMEAHVEERRGSGISGRHDEDPEVLYTMASDGFLRVWRTGGLHDLEILALHASIDLVTAIPQSPTLKVNGSETSAKPPRYAFTIPSERFCAAVTAASVTQQKGKVNHSFEHLKEVASKEPDVIVALDGSGRMSAWGIQSIGHKRRPDTPVSTQAYHLTHTEDLSLKIPPTSPAQFATWFQDDRLIVLAHALGQGGELTWWQGSVETFFSPSAAGPERLERLSAWSGHASEILALDVSDEYLASSSSQEACLWSKKGDVALEKCGNFGGDSTILAAAPLLADKGLLTVHAQKLVLRSLKGTAVAETACEATEPGRIHTSFIGADAIKGLYVQSDGECAFTWTAEFTESKFQLSVQNLKLSEHDAFRNVAFAVPVLGSLEHEQTRLISLDRDGKVRGWSIPKDITTLNWNKESGLTYTTGLSDASLFAANPEFAAVASQDAREIVIMDLVDGYIEHRRKMDQRILNLACFAARPTQNLLAVGQSATIEILAQGRYEQRSSDLSSWLHIKTISIAGIGFQINAITFTQVGGLAVAAGNSIFEAAPELESRNLQPKLLEVLDDDFDAGSKVGTLQLARKLKSSLPVWHPAFLTYLVVQGQSALATSLLRLLAQKLRFWSVGEDLDPLLGREAAHVLDSPSVVEDRLSDDTVAELKEQLTEKRLPSLFRKDQIWLRQVLDAVRYIQEHTQGLDAHALRYLFDWKTQLLFTEDQKPGETNPTKVNGINPEQPFVPEMHWREIAFARHSTTQQPLLDILVLHYDNKLTWRIARRLGIMAWLSEREALEQIFEQLAQSAYRASQPPDPVNASLYFLALNKKPTLLALWRIATWHREQRSTLNFLKRDFTQADAMTAAKKNAYALMGKRRFEYAATFFLLANDPASATSLLAGQCEDIQLAIAVARLSCGDGSAVLKKLLEERMLPQAERDGNRWLASWCHSILSEKDEAAHALVTPRDGVKTWHQDEPSTLLLYKQLRSAPSEHEYNAVIRTARILRRMSLELFAVQLLSGWKFRSAKSASATKGEGVGNGVANGVRHELQPTSDEDSAPQEQPKAPPFLLGNFASQEPAPAPPVDEKAARAAKAAELLQKLKAKKEGAAKPPGVEKKKPEPTQFKEPDSNSLLDSFGF